MINGLVVYSLTVTQHICDKVLPVCATATATWSEQGSVLCGHCNLFENRTPDDREDDLCGASGGIQLGGKQDVLFTLTFASYVSLMLHATSSSVHLPVPKQLYSSHIYNNIGYATKTWNSTISLSKGHYKKTQTRFCVNSKWRPLTVT